VSAPKITSINTSRKIPFLCLIVVALTLSDL